MINKTEQEIMKNWKGNMDQPLVSVCCSTFNHENYIAEALDSFLMQVTNFPFEIIVRDDASQDSTVDIINRYLKLFPNIIKPIYEITNQYSKGVKPMPVIFKKASGKYFALCEGDDYWTDAKKLQIQIDEMKLHPQLNISFHSAYALKSEKYSIILSKHAKENKIFNISEVIIGGGDFCPTASLIVSRDVMLDLPDFYKEAPIGDYFIQVLGALRGGALYINKTMSIYRLSTVGSWTNRTNRKEVSGSVEELNKLLGRREEFTIKFIKSLKEMNIYFKRKYSSEIEKMESNILYGLSIFYLKNGMLKKFQDTITLSYSLDIEPNMMKKIIYSFKIFPKFLKLLHTIKNY